MRLACLAALISSSIACKDTPRRAPEATPAVAPAPEEALAPWSDAWLLAQTGAFLDDTAARRAALEASLTNHDNLYSRQRLASYGLGTQGWDRLPVWKTA